MGGTTNMGIGGVGQGRSVIQALPEMAEGLATRADQAEWYGGSLSGDQADWYGQVPQGDQAAWYGQVAQSDQEAWYGLDKEYSPAARADRKAQVLGHPDKDLTEREISSIRQWYLTETAKRFRGQMEEYRNGSNPEVDAELIANTVVDLAEMDVDPFVAGEANPAPYMGGVKAGRPVVVMPYIWSDLLSASAVTEKKGYIGRALDAIKGKLGLVNRWYMKLMYGEEPGSNRTTAGFAAALEEAMRRGAPYEGGIKAGKQAEQWARMQNWVNGRGTKILSVGLPIMGAMQLAFPDSVPMKTDEMASFLLLGGIFLAMKPDDPNSQPLVDPLKAQRERWAKGSGVKGPHQERWYKGGIKAGEQAERWAKGEGVDKPKDEGTAMKPAPRPGEIPSGGEEIVTEPGSIRVYIMPEDRWGH